jgi:uncharacterized protein
MKNEGCAVRPQRSDRISWPEHAFHDDAHAWFQRHGKKPWATCPLTENGCLRILSRPRANVRPFLTSEVATALRSLTSLGAHEFWPDSVSLLDETIFDDGQVSGGKQLTDIMLLGLTVRRSGRLVTFDRNIPIKAVRGAKASHIELLVSKR